MNWQELCLLRGSLSALHLKDNFVESVLCGASSHHDVINSDFIIYKVPNRNFYKKSIASMKNNEKERYPIKVFQKEGINQWITKGNYQISNISENSDEVIIKLTLIK